MLELVLRSKTKTKSAESIPVPIASTSDNNEEENVASLEYKTSQILAILPHLSPSHVTHLMQDDRFGGNVEHFLEGLLDGSLGSEWEDVDEEKGSGKGKQRAKSQEYKRDAFGYDVTERRNVFDNGKEDVG